jgi:hypothetical protein
VGDGLRPDTSFHIVQPWTERRYRAPSCGNCDTSWGCLNGLWRRCQGFLSPPSPKSKPSADSRQPTLTLVSKIVESAGLAIEVRLVPVDPHSPVAAANKVKDRLTGPAGAGLPINIREDGALRAVLDLKDGLRQADREQFTVLVEFPPSLIGDTRWDAFIAAVVEDEAAAKDIPPPRWTNDPSRFNKPFWYLSENRELHTWELTTAPGAFVRHGILAARDELESV